MTETQPTTGPTAETTTKLARLTRANTLALADTVDVGTTVATFPGTPGEALALLDIARQALARDHGTRGHPVASIPAVRRRIIATDGFEYADYHRTARRLKGR
ncbi:hypothetical protein SEA_FLOAT294_92 [Gordonia phage Float294]|nr:hypothetical protein SEA_FLOAT294_92 [Gordonia phage Float294]